MKTLALTFGVLAAMIAVPVMAQQGGNRTSPDSNNDGVVTRAEVETGVARRFAKLDANQDGRVDEGDRSAHRKAKQGGIFGMMDADRNGNISRVEFDAATTVRQAERSERRAAMAGRRGERKYGYGMRGMRGQGGERRLAIADANGDKAVTPAEMLTAALARFDRIDANKDGQVTAEERAAMRAERGQGRRDGPAVPMPGG